MENGKVYSYFIDPILAPLHQSVLGLLDEDTCVLDLACGTGELALKMASKVNRVVGIDHSPSMIKTSNTKLENTKLNNVEFRQMDIVNDDLKFDFSIDIIVISLAIHQFSLEEANIIIEKMKKLSKRFIIVDYHWPLPNNFYGIATKLIERIAGRQHFINFKSYMKNDGLDYYIRMHNLINNSGITKGKSVFTIRNLLHES